MKKLKMCILIFAFSAIMQATLFNICSLALTQDGIFLLNLNNRNVMHLDLIYTHMLTYRLSMLFAGITLLDLKSTLNDSKNFLSDWRDSDETPCQWTGISCNADDHTVSSMYVYTLYLH